jgi:RNA polymerase primary sigma factor
MTERRDESTSSIPENFNKLIEQGTERGYVTFEEISNAFPKPEQNLDQLEELFDLLEGQGIKVYDDKDQPLGEQAPDGAAESIVEVQQEALDDEAGFQGIPIEDTTSLYFHEVGQVPLLTREEEVYLGHQWQTAREAEQRLALNGHDEAERERLQREIAQGYAARDHLIKANTRLVISIAKRYQGQGLPFQDLIQEGNLGLMRAVDKFDPDLGYKFSTYATWWIRQAVTRALADQGRTIRLPVHMADSIRRLHRTIHELEQESGRSPTVEEIADEMEIDTRRVQWMMRVARQPLSLETPVGEEQDSELGYFIEDEEAPAPAEETDHSLLRETLEELIDTLDPREARILRLRFGFQDGSAYTLEEVGEKFGLTRERVRQIEQRALQRLRHPRRSRHVRDYW